MPLLLLAGAEAVQVGAAGRQAASPLAAPMGDIAVRLQPLPRQRWRGQQPPFPPRLSPRPESPLQAAPCLTQRRLRPSRGFRP